MESANSFSETNWNSIESILDSDFILTCQKRLDTLPFYFPDSDLRSGARKPLQPCYKIEFHVLARCGRCSLYSLQVGGVQMNSRCQRFPLFTFQQERNRRNINEKQFGINLVYDCNSARGHISSLVTAGKHMCMRP